MRGSERKTGAHSRHSGKWNWRSRAGESVIHSEGTELNIGPALPGNPSVSRSIGSYLAEIERWRWWRSYDIIRVSIAGSAGFAAVIGIIVKSVVK